MIGSGTSLVESTCMNVLVISIELNYQKAAVFSRRVNNTFLSLCTCCSRCEAFEARCRASSLISDLTTISNLCRLVSS